MLNKLLKYDLKYMIKNMSIFYILAIFFSILTRILFSLKQTLIVNIIGQITVGCMFSMIASILINVMMRSWVRFRDSIYKDEAYLTHTLPVTKNNIYNSKFIQTLIFFVFSFVIAILALFIAYFTKERWLMLKGLVASITTGLNFNTTLFVIGVILVVFLEIFNAIQCGFLGLLHLEIIEERLDREFDLGLITTAPSVIYKVYKTDGQVMELYNPEDLPKPQEISYIEEPFVTANILTPKEYVGNIMELCQRRRGIYIDMKYLDENRVTLIYEMPLNEIIYDFFDNLKSKTKGYASLDYEFKDYRKSNLVKLDIYINGEMVDALSFIVHKEGAYDRGKKMVEKLKTVIPRKLFKIPIQAAIGGQIIARETISAMRKDVLAKCYGGDITRKKKLLEKQKRGKKKMREIGNVEIPQEAFLSVLKLDDE